MKVLIDNPGPVEAERFVYLVNKGTIDYTQWRQNLYEGMSAREISTLAMELRWKMKEETEPQS